MRRESAEQGTHLKTSTCCLQGSGATRSAAVTGPSRSTTRPQVRTVDVIVQRKTGLACTAPPRYARSRPRAGSRQIGRGRRATACGADLRPSCPNTNFLIVDGRSSTPSGRSDTRELTSTTFGYWITSSAPASSEFGMPIPSDFAVFRLMSSSYFVGCSIGMSAGLAPFRILSTKSPALRNTAGRLSP